MDIRCILLDVEGTTSSIHFVYGKMFPYVRESLDTYVRAHWDRSLAENQSFFEAVAKLGEDIGESESWLDELSPESSIEKVIAAVTQLMDDDIKATGLKQLQGMIWKDGFESGTLVAHLFEDVAPAIRTWHESGLEIRIYSSGSVQAQKLFFGHTEAGDLLPLIGGHYDTTTGPKKDSTSYSAIAADLGVAPARVLFVSDVVAELDAASNAGMQVMLSLRAGNKPVESGHGYREIRSFSEITWGE